MPNRCAHELFETQVERTPDAAAVALGDERLTYRELNARANQLAHALGRLGVGPEVLVGVCVKRSLEMVVAILGVLKAGGAYVPLDPEYPRQRLAFMLADTRAPVLLTQPALLPTLPAHESLVFCLHPTWETLAGEPRDNPQCRAAADSLAYVMYTSGSSGQPKGILVPHGGLVNYLTWCAQTYRVAAGTGAPVHSSFAFDLTITSLFAPLVAGRTVHLLPEGYGIDTLRQAFRQASDFSLVKITPAHLELLGQLLAPGEAGGRTRAFIIGGENLTGRQIAFWQNFAPKTLLVNEYGPTETVVGCCVYFVPQGKHFSGSIPIGQPIANTQLYVLDADLRQLPPGATGELYIGGGGLARGYHNRPDLTAEKFIPDPFGGESGARLYRTGDLVRSLPDGNLEFLGRIDQQVKVHGFRIEPGEVEAALALHPSVQQAVVVVREDVPAEKRLVAYVVPQPGQTLTTPGMRAFLQARLPDYLIPTALLLLDALPLTTNGKVDRRALPAPDHTKPTLTGHFVAAGNPLEARMVRLWEEVLRVRPIGVRDNFFELGGESLLAVRLFAKIHKSFGRDLPLASLLQAPTVELLVRLLDKPEGHGFEHLVLLQPAGARAPFFCVPGIGGDALTLTELARHLGADRPFYALQARRPGDGLSSRPSLEEIAAQYLEAILTVQPDGRYYLGGFSFGGTVAFEVARQLHARGKPMGLLAILDQRSHPAPTGARFEPAFLLEFLKNIPPWLRYDLFQTKPGAMLTRVRLRTRAALTQWARSLPRHGVHMHQGVADAGANFDLSHQSEQSRRLLEHHFQVLRDYVPRPYPGRVTLLRARAQSLSRLQGRDLGWGALAGGGSDVIIVPGSHDTLLKEPYVRALAGRLRACLENAEAAASGRDGQVSLMLGPLSTPAAKPAATEASTAAEESPGGCWSVVVNHEGQFSLWPTGRPCAPGWQVVGAGGTRAECLAYIQKVWLDLRPLSLQKAAASEGSDTDPDIQIRWDGPLPEPLRPVGGLHARSQKAALKTPFGK
jgi:amino acid adenylation domain-containing protein